MHRIYTQFFIILADKYYLIIHRKTIADARDLRLFVFRFASIYIFGQFVRRFYLNELIRTVYFGGTVAVGG